MNQAQSKRDAALRRLRITTRAVIVAAAAAGALVMELAHASTPNHTGHAARDHATADKASRASGVAVTHSSHRHRLLASSAPTSSGSGSGSVTSGPS
jgi:hypothetical protein